MSLTIIPHKPEIPLVGGVLFGHFEEDLELGILRFRISENKDVPFSLRLEIYRETLIDVKLEASFISGTTTDFLALSRYSRKMTDREYRRFVILNSRGDQLLISSCPNVKDGFSPMELNIFRELNAIEQDLGEAVGVPVHYTTAFVNKLSRIYNDRSTWTKEKLQTEIEQMKQLHHPLKFTEFNVVFRGDSSASIRSEIQGWIQYKSLGLTSTKASMRSHLQKVIKNQAAFSMHIKSKVFTVKDFFSALQQKTNEPNILKSISELLDQKVEATQSYKTEINIHFNNPYKRGWFNVQQVDIEVNEVDPSLNELEALLATQQYVEAIPLLERYKDNFLEDLAFAYTQDQKYDESIEIANEAIQRDLRSVAHFSKGLAYVGKKKFESAYEAYERGTYACTAEWYPIAKDNLLSFLTTNQIPLNDMLHQIIEQLDKQPTPLSNKDRCYCGARRKFRNCHG